MGAKKAEAVQITQEQAKALKGEQSDTPQGRRDAFLMCLLLDHGLRCGEIAALSPETINLSTGLLTFYRQKVDKVQTHQLTRDTLLAAMRYLKICKPVSSLLMGSRKGGKLEGVMSERAITDRVRELGERIGVKGLSAHDCRHDWARSAVKESDIKSLQQAGGWSSPAVRRLLFLPVLSITQQQKGLFFCFINGARFSNHFERRCQGKSDSGLDIYAQNGTLCAAIDNRRYRHV